MPSEEDKSALRTSHTLLERVRDQNDEDSWKEFIDYYRPYIYNILRHIRIPESDAEEICQELIIRLWKKMPEFVYNKDRGKFRNYLGVIIRNEGNNYFRKNKRKETLFEPDDEKLDKASDSEDAFNVESVITEEWHNYISNLAWESINKRFKEKTKNAFLLHMDGKSTKEIAEACGLQSSGVYVAIHRVQLHLKEEIKRLNNELL